MSITVNIFSFFSADIKTAGIKLRNFKPDLNCLSHISLSMLSFFDKSDLLIAIINMAMSVIGVAGVWQRAVYGFIILISISIDHLFSKVSKMNE